MKYLVTIKDTRYNEFNVYSLATSIDDAIEKVSKIVEVSKKHSKVRSDPKGYTVTAKKVTI
jgi:hypothetical protein